MARGGADAGCFDCDSEGEEVKTTTGQMRKLAEIHHADVFVKTNGEDGFYVYRYAGGGALDSVAIGEGSTAEEALANALGQAKAELRAKLSAIDSVLTRKQKPRGFRFDGAPKAAVTRVEIGDETIEVGADSEEEA